MNYQRIHDAIIDRARNKTLIGYVEKHHVIPRCIDALCFKEGGNRTMKRWHFDNCRNK
jgi:hypothetical protein